MKIVLLIVLVLLLIVAPLAVIWALNTLFGLGIAYNFWTWLSVVILCVIFNSPSKSKG